MWCWGIVYGVLGGFFFLGECLEGKGMGLWGFRGG